MTEVMKDKKDSPEVFESGIKIKEYHFQWRIKGLDLPFNTGLQTCPSLIEKLSMKFKICDLQGYPATWKLSLMYSPMWPSLMLQAVPDLEHMQKKGIKDQDTYHAVLEVKEAGKFTLLQKKTQIVNILEYMHHDKGDGQNANFNVGSNAILPFGNTFPPTGLLPLKLPLFRCNEEFFNVLESQKGCINLALKFTQLDAYVKRGHGEEGEIIEISADDQLKNNVNPDEGEKKDRDEKIMSTDKASGQEGNNEIRGISQEPVLVEPVDLAVSATPAVNTGSGCFPESAINNAGTEVGGAKNVTVVCGNPSVGSDCGAGGTSGTGAKGTLPGPSGNAASIPELHQGLKRKNAGIVWPTLSEKDSANKEQQV